MKWLSIQSRGLVVLIVSIFVMVLTTTVAGGRVPVALADACTVPAGTSITTFIANNATCSTITLEAGTYTEQVAITRPLTLTGQGSSTIIRFPLGTPTIQMDANAGYVISAQASGVTIENLLVDAQNFTCDACDYSAYDMGIDLGKGDVTITNVNVQNANVAIGSVVQGSGQVTVSNSTLRGFHTAVLAGPYGATFSFMGNTVIGTPGMEQMGIEGGNTISGNTFENIHMGGSRPNLAAGAIFQTAVVGSASSIVNNIFTNVDNGILVSNPNATQGAIISGNTFSGTESAVTLAINGAAQVVRNNHIHNTMIGGWGYEPGIGITVCGDRGDTVSGNTISGSAQYGVALLAYQAAGCKNTGPGYYPTTDNTISGNTVSGSGVTDLYDSTQGTGTSGTANHYASNTCGASQPAGLCAATASGAPVPPTGGSTPPSKATRTATATPTTAARETATTSVTGITGSGGTTLTAQHRTSQSSGGFPVMPVVLGLLLLAAAGGAVTFFVRRARPSLAPASIPVGAPQEQPLAGPDDSTLPGGPGQ